MHTDERKFCGDLLHGHDMTFSLLTYHTPTQTYITLLTSTRENYTLIFFTENRRNLILFKVLSDLFAHAAIQLDNNLSHE